MALNIFTIVRCVLLFIALILACVGTGVEWVTNGSGDSKSKSYLYGYKSPNRDLVKWSDLDLCSEAKDRANASYAFSIITCIIVAFALVAVALTLVLSGLAKILNFASIGLSAVAFVTSLLAWAIYAGTFHKGMCGADASSKNSDNKLAAGFALLIVVWILAFVDIAIAIFTTFFGAKAAAVEANE